MQYLLLFIALIALVRAVPPSQMPIMAYEGDHFIRGLLQLSDAGYCDHFDALFSREAVFENPAGRPVIRSGARSHIQGSPADYCSAAFAGVDAGSIHQDILQVLPALSGAESVTEYSFVTYWNAVVTNAKGVCKVRNLNTGSVVLGRNNQGALQVLSCRSYFDLTPQAAFVDYNAVPSL